MNCIFICVFNQTKYVDMFFLLLESIFIYGSLDENTKILIYTSTPFMNMIKDSHLFNNDKIEFEINDAYNNIDKACKARLDLFNLPSITKYDKILYLDTDILIKDNIKKVFDICKEDTLYVLEEGEIDSKTDYWGLTLFGDEVNNYNDKTAFTSGILLFNNCEKIKGLFSKINEDIINRPYKFVCCDQPYIVYNAFTYNLYDNKLLKPYVVNNDNNIYSDKVIHHFPGGPGIYQHKIHAMTIFLNKINESNSKLNTIITSPTQTHNNESKEEIILFETRNEMLKYYCNKLFNPKLLEIGVFRGAFLDYLVNNCKIGSIDAVDLFEGITTSGDVDGNNVLHYDVGLSYLELLDKYKDMPNIKIHKSNSITFLQNQDDNIYDIIYIDGDHSYEGVKKDLLNAYKKIKNGGYIMGHDYEMNMKKAKNVYKFGVKQAVDEFCINYNQNIISKAYDGCVSYCILIHKNETD